MVETLGGRYQLAELLGSGENGEVWRARDKGTDREVVVKLFHQHLAADIRLVDRLLRARNVLTGLWHPGIARLLDVVVEAHQLALVTDIVPGSDLGRRLAQTGPFPAAVAAQIAAIIADALATAHRVGVVHGDLKPSNVMLGPRGSGIVQLTDFSVALQIRAGRHRAETSPYLPPDVIDGAVPGPSSDVYALGLLLCEMVTGKPMLPEHDRDESDELLRLVDDCLSREAAARPDAQEVHDRLQALLTGVPLPARQHPISAPPMMMPVSAPPYSPPPPLPVLARPRVVGHALPPPERQRWGIWAGVAAAVVIAVVAFIVLQNRPSGDGQAIPGPQSTAPQSIGVPSLPVGATASTPPGGQAFLEHWFAVLNYAVRTGDTSTLDSVTNSACSQCRTAAEAIKGAFADGGSLTGGSYIVRRVATSNLWTPERAVYDVTIDRTPRTHLDRSGNTRATLPGLSFTNCVLVLEWAEGRWRLLEIPTPGCVG